MPIGARLPVYDGKGGSTLETLPEQMRLCGVPLEVGLAVSVAGGGVCEEGDGTICSVPSEVELFVSFIWPSMSAKIKFHSINKSSSRGYPFIHYAFMHACTHALCSATIHSIVTSHTD